MWLLHACEMGSFTASGMQCLKACFSALDQMESAERKKKKKPSLSRFHVMFNQSECRTVESWFTVMLTKSSPVLRSTYQISVPHWLHCISSVNFGGTFHMTKDYWIAHRSCWLCWCLLFLYGYFKGLIWNLQTLHTMSLYKSLKNSARRGLKSLCSSSTCPKAGEPLLECLSLILSLFFGVAAIFAYKNMWTITGTDSLSECLQWSWMLFENPGAGAIKISSTAHMWRG